MPLSKLDKLAANMMLDQVRDLINDADETVEKTMLDEYQEWLAEIQGRKGFEAKPFAVFRIFDPVEYTKLQHTIRLVLDMIHEDMIDKRYYHENQEEIQSLVSQAVSMAIFVQKKSADCEAEIERMKQC